MKDYDYDCSPFLDDCYIIGNERKESFHSIDKVHKDGAIMRSKINCQNTSNLKITFLDRQTKISEPNAIENDQTTLVHWGHQLSFTNHRDTTIIISNTIIKDIDVIIDTVTIRFFNCTFHKVLILDNSAMLGGYMDITFNGCEFDCKYSNSHMMSGLQIKNFAFVQLSIFDTKLTFCALNLRTNSLLLSIQNSILFNTYNKISVRSFFQVPSIINIQKTNFINNRSTTYDEPFSMKLLNPYVIINRSTFHGVPLEIASVPDNAKQHLYFVQIMDSYFVNSNKDGSGGGLLISSDVEGAVCKLFNLTFLENMAKLGGALYVEGKSLLLVIESCRFSGNQADDVGGSFYASQGVILDINKSFFHSKIIAQIPLPVISILGTVRTIIAEIKIDNLSPFLYNSAFKVFTIERLSDYLSINVACPSWYRHSFEFGMSNNKQLKNHSNQSITNLKFECGLCSEGYYTTEPRSNNISYFGIISSHNKSTDSMCNPCPYGAHCSGNNVVARPNFWGLYQSGDLLFQQCPKQYCCSGDNDVPCKMYNTCAKHRTGILCGECKNDFSVSMLTPDCIPNSECGGDQWFWLIVLITMLSYTVWYTFKNDIMRITFLGIDSMMTFCNANISRFCVGNLNSEVLSQDYQISVNNSVEKQDESFIL